jgi:lysozyme
MAFPAGSVPGIDVSHYQGVVDWASVAAGGEAFAFCKATEGVNTVDQYFHDNWQGIKAAGLLRGAYHFFHPNLDAAAQAASFLAALRAANGSATLAPGDLPVTLDLEVTGGVSAAALIAGAKTWLETVEAATGRTPLLYTFTAFWKSLGNPSDLSEYPLWVARYGAPAPGPLGGWSDWTIWQFSSTSSISGVTGQCDADGFHGSTDQLHALAGIAPGATA